MNHDEILKFIKETERDEDEKPQRNGVINSDDIINLQIALNETAPNGTDPFEHFLNRV